MLLLWHTPPKAGAQREYADWLMAWRTTFEQQQQEDESILLLWWSMVNKEN